MPPTIRKECILGKLQLLMEQVQKNPNLDKYHLTRHFYGMVLLQKNRLTIKFPYQINKKIRTHNQVDDIISLQ